MKVLLSFIPLAIVLLGLGCESPDDSAAELSELPAPTAVFPVESNPTLAPLVAPPTSRASPVSVENRDTASTALPGDLVAARVDRVIDGDTIEVEVDGQLYTIRYIGVVRFP